MKTMPWLSGVMAVGILAALPAGLRAEDAPPAESHPDRRERGERRYNRRYEENGKETFDRFDTNKDGIIDEEEAKKSPEANLPGARKRWEMAGGKDADTAGLPPGMTLQEAKEQREREEAAYNHRIDRYLENHPRLRERWQGLSEDERAHLRQRIHAKVRECRDNPGMREALRDRIKARYRNTSPEERRRFLEHHPGAADRLEDVRDHREDVRDRREDVRDARHDGGLRDRIEDRHDRRENLRDRREDVGDRRENRRENVRDRRHEPGDPRR